MGRCRVGHLVGIQLGIGKLCQHNFEHNRPPSIGAYAGIIDLILKGLLFSTNIWDLSDSTCQISFACPLRQFLASILLFRAKSDFSGGFKSSKMLELDDDDKALAILSTTWH